MSAKCYGSVFLLLASIANANPKDDVLQGVETNVLGCRQGVLASPLSTTYGGYIEADFLYWVPHEEGLEYAFRQNSPSGNAPANFDNPSLMAKTVGGHFDRINFEWEPAVRIEAGYMLPVDDWSIFARWTRFEEHAHGNSSITSLTTDNIAALWLGAEFFNAGYLRVLSASAKWNLHYNVVDAGLSRTFYWGSHLVLKPETGVRGFWINQRFAVNYAGGDVTASPASFKGINNFDGAGLFGQLTSKWFFHCNWSVVGQFLGSVNFGRLRLGQQTASQIQLTTVAPVRQIISEVVHRTRFAYQAGIGLEWSAFLSRFCKKDDRKLAFSVMYELSEWLHINQLRRFAYSDFSAVANFMSMEGTLGFQGISVTGRFDY